MQNIKVCIKFDVHTDTKQGLDNWVGSYGKPELLILKVLDIKKHAFFWVQPFKRFIGTTPTSKNIIFANKVILNILPVLGVAEENQQDSAICGGYLEL